MALAAAGALGAGFVLDRVGAKRALALGFLLFPSWSESAVVAVHATVGVGSFSAGLLRSALDLGAVYRLAALPPLLAAVLALRSTATRDA
jgi:hypothetical protein